VEKRIGDRRDRARFEIVGTLTGTLETSRRLAVRNLGPCGALVETSVPLAVNHRINGKLSFRGQTREVRGVIRHTGRVAAGESGSPYLVGIEWVDKGVEINDLLGLASLKTVHSGPRHGVERRAHVRISAAGEAEIDEPAWSTVELVDISASGVLFVSPLPLDVGETGQLRVRLSERSFTARIEVRRSDTSGASHSTHHLGAAFVSLDDVNRTHLEDFVGGARR
jgi:hypothetical protein